jgi:tetratricopeptide (TPR) repeat protein
MKFRQSSRGKGLVIYCLLLLALAFSGCAGSPAARRDKHVARGRQFAEKHDYSRAILEFKNAAKATPKDPEVYYQLGMAYLGTRDFRSALGAFRQTLALNPKHAQAQLRIAQMQAATPNEKLWKDADSTLKALVESAAPTPEMLQTLALTEFKLHDMEHAIQDFERVLAQSPGELSASVMLAMAKLSLKDAKGAEQVLQKASKDAPASADAHRVLADFYRDQKRLPEAEAELRRALEIDPNSGPSILDLAKLELAEGRNQEAEQNFKRLAAFESYKPVYAYFLFEQGRRDDAIREFERVARENPDDREARTNLVAAYHTANRMEDVNRVLGAALKKNPKDVDALLQRGEILVQTGKYEQAEIDLNQVRSLRPTAPEVHYVLAKLNQARGSTLAYRQELSEALRLNPHLERIRVELAQSLLTHSGARAALAVLDSAPAAQSRSIPILVERNWTLWALGDTAEMRKGIDRGLLQVRSADLLIQDGLCKLRSGDFAGARTALGEAFKIDPADLRALKALHQTYVAQKNGPMALQKVKEYAARQPKSAPVHEFLGTLLVANGDRTQARAAFAAAKLADPQSVDPDFSLAQLDVMEGKPEDARKRLEGVLATHSSNATAELWLGNLDDQRGNYPAAIEHFRKVVQMSPDNGQASNNLAYLLAEYGKQPDVALKYAEKAVEIAPDRPAYCDTLGWILYRKGVYSSAVRYLEQASRDPGNVVWKYHLAMAYAKAGQVSRGRTTLEAALKINPNLPEAKTAQQMIGASR